MRRLQRAAAALAIAASTACATSYVAKPPEPEDDVARYRREITKVRFAVDATKALIDRSRGQPYLPDLYLRLAELYVEEVRYHYFIAYEGQKRRDRAVTSVQARLVKNQAIAVYKRILEEFPDYKDRDKVLFYIAHEYRELGEYDQMTTYLRRVVDEHPSSSYANEALLVLGDHHFDRAELEAAEKYYRRIIQGPESGTHAMARYKLAWVRINKEDWKGALALFEQTIEGLASANKPKEADNAVSSQPGAAPSARKLDLRREALVDLVFPYTEVHKKPAKPLAYFRDLADSRTTYLAALSKLANRWFVKGEYAMASNVYRELLRLGADNEDSVEWARRLYDGVIKEKELKYTDVDVRLIAAVAERRAFDWRVENKARAQLEEELENYARDLATKTQLLADQKKDAEIYGRAADAYRAYLAWFGKSPKAAEMRQNMAESRFAAKQFLDAGRAYASVVDVAPEAEKKDAIYTAVVSYHNALKEPAKLSRLELLEARAGLRAAARSFLERFPSDTNVARVKFSFAKSVYDAGDFDEAAELFAALVEQFPSSEEAGVSAELALDALRAREDFEEMTRLGRRLAADNRLSADLRAELTKIVTSAESRALDQATVAAGAEGDQAAQNLMSFAEKHKGDTLGERALINAFGTAVSSDDLEKVAAIGDQILQQYPKSEAVPDVLATLGKLSAQAVDFERSARYLEESAKRQRTGAGPLLRAVATIRLHLGDAAGAKEAANALIERAAEGREKREAAMFAAGLMELGRDPAAAAEALDAAIAAGEKSADAEYRLGRALAQSGKGQEAQKRWKDAMDTGSRSSDPEERDAAAGGAYRLALPAYEELVRMPADGEPAQLITRKFTALSAAEQKLFQVIDLGAPRWAIPSLALLAAAYEDTASFLERLPVPAGVEGASLEKYKATLAQRAAELHGKAQEAQGTCGSKAAELKLLGVATIACRKGGPFGGDPEIKPAIPSRRGAPDASQVSALRKRIAKNSKDYEALARLAELYLAADDVMQAKLVLDKAAEGGADASIYNLRAVVADKLGEPEQALEELDKALEAEDGNAIARRNLATLYDRYGFEALAKTERAKLGAAPPPARGDPKVLSEEAPR